MGYFIVGHITKSFIIYSGPVSSTLNSHAFPVNLIVHLALSESLYDYVLIN